MFSRGIGTNNGIGIKRYKPYWCKGAGFWFALKVMYIVKLRKWFGITPTDAEANVLGQSYGKGDELDSCTVGVLSRPE